MKYEVFCQKIAALVKRTQPNTRVRFSNDLEAGKFIARLTDGSTIIGRPGSLKLTIRYGSGHQMMATM